MAEATEDLSFARGVYAVRSEKGRIFGTVTYPVNSDDHPPRKPVANAEISVKDAWGKLSTVKTDSMGRYDFFAPQGTSWLTPVLPAGMSFGTANVELLDSRGCAEAHLSVSYAGRIMGRVLTASGMPVPNFTVELLTAKGRDSPFSQPRAVTDSAGRFEMSGVQPGSYIPAIAVDYVPRTASGGTEVETRYLFPGGAKRKDEVQALWVDGSHVGRAELVVPRTLRVVQVSGLVVDADGRPAKGVEVRTKADFDYFDLAWTTIRTDDAGRFKLGLVAGNRYRMVAELKLTAAPYRRTSRIALVPVAGMAPLRFVLR
jgi:5-hydroxyisourate hydrolase-like protein (transthyretin family)